MNHTIGFLGFGEVGQRFAADLRAANPRGAFLAYDIAQHQAAAGEPLRRRAQEIPVQLADDVGALADSCGVIFSAVTAEQTLAAARSVCARPLGDAWFIDLNSAAPATKIECAALISAAGGRYVEAAVMTSVPPYGIRVPMLLGGAHAGDCAPLLTSLGFSVQVAAADLGVASAIKLCRSVIIKGLESLVVESFTAARALGVEPQVLASLKETYPQFDWEKQGDYLFSRVIQHGKRRAEEMRASASMIDAIGVRGTMAHAIADRQESVAALRGGNLLNEPATLKPWRERADQMLTRWRQE